VKVYLSVSEVGLILAFHLNRDLIYKMNSYECSDLPLYQGVHLVKWLNILHEEITSEKLMIL
jgi:hypothetical protein